MTWILLATLLTTFQSQSLIVRFEKAYGSEKLTLELIHLLEQKHALSALETAYLGSFNMLMANHSFNPFHKLAYFQEGKSLIASAIEKNPENVEIRYLRFINQVETPQLLGYKSRINEDKKIILDHIIELRGTEEYDHMLKYLLECSELTNEEKKTLEK